MTTMTQRRGTPAQVELANRLLAEREVPTTYQVPLFGETTAAELGSVIEYLLSLPVRQTVVDAAPRFATAKQREFIRRLLAEKDTTGTRFTTHSQAPDNLSTKGASATIEELLPLPRKVAAPS
jgi:hypothetical protein